VFIITYRLALLTCVSYRSHNISIVHDTLIQIMVNDSLEVSLQEVLKKFHKAFCRVGGTTKKHSLLQRVIGINRYIRLVDATVLTC
jgi:hypothetical protein